MTGRVFSLRRCAHRFLPRARATPGFATAAHDLSAAARARALDEDRRRHTAAHPPADLADLEWADGIVFGTPISARSLAPSLMRFLARTEPLWKSGRLSDKAVTVFTDEPEDSLPVRRCTRSTTRCTDGVR